MRVIEQSVIWGDVKPALAGLTGERVVMLAVFSIRFLVAVTVISIIIGMVVIAMAVAIATSKPFATG